MTLYLSLKSTFQFLIVISGAPLLYVSESGQIWLNKMRCGLFTGDPNILTLLPKLGNTVKWKNVHGWTEGTPMLLLLLLLHFCSCKWNQLCKHTGRTWACLGMKRCYISYISHMHTALAVIFSNPSIYKLIPHKVFHLPSTIFMCFSRYATEFGAANKIISLCHCDDVTESLLLDSFPVCVYVPVCEYTDVCVH